MEPTASDRQPRATQPQTRFVFSREDEQENRAAGGQSQTEKVQPGVTPDRNLAASTEPLNSYPTGLTKSAAARRQTATPIWLQRVWLIIYVVFCIELGMLLAVLPWTTVWSSNGLVANNLPLRSLLQHNFVRGVITGLGLLDIWIGISEAVHYRDRK